MASFKLQHTSFVNKVLRVTDHSLAYPTPFQCATCQTQHTHKTHHLYLNSSGQVTVDAINYATILAIAGGVDLSSLGLSVIDPLVLNPPALSLGQGGTWVQHDIVDAN